MKLRVTFRATLLLGLCLAPPALQAQAPLPASPSDTTRKYQSGPSEAAGSRPFYKSKVFKATIVPAVLIGYGLSTINGNGIYSSYDARRDILRTFPGFRTSADDYFQFVPYLELGATVLAGVESRSDRLNLLLVVAKSEAIMLTTVYTIKTATGILRPDGSARNALPSGHTAQAFLAASIVHTELRDKSQWYGIGAYTVATSVGVLRMLNNRHWQSDVFAGAGVGILSAHLAYLSHRNRWGRKPIGRDVGLMPFWSPAGGTGLTFTWQPK